MTVTPTRCTDRATRTRPQAHTGCSYQAPPAGQGLTSPGSRRGSERLPGWDLPIPPVRSRLPLTSLGGEDRPLPAPRQQLFTPARTASPGPRSRAVEAAARTPERAGSRPSRSAPWEAVSYRRRCPLLLLFLSTSCSPHTLPSGSREAGHGRRLHPLLGHPGSSEPQATLWLSLPVGLQWGRLLSTD